MTVVTSGAPAWLNFDLPVGRVASEPPEARGLRRDQVRMMVSRAGQDLFHGQFSDLASHLSPGDLLVVNVSATLPAALDARLGDGTLVALHLSTRLPAGLHLVEVRRPAPTASQPWLDAALAGAEATLDGGGTVHVLAPYPGSTRLWLARLDLPVGLLGYLGAHGRPIRYAHVKADWPISMYQSVYSTEPGSAEMASAGRPFTGDVLSAVMARGVGVTPVVLHAGVSSADAGEPPAPEEYRVPAITAERVNAARARGSRVVAVGTTVVRALETTADDRGVAHPGQGWTDRVVTAAAPPRVVDGLLTGWHEPQASHLWMLEALSGRHALSDAYAAALVEGYLWHEFGDVHLLLP